MLFKFRDAEENWHLYIQIGFLSYLSDAGKKTFLYAAKIKPLKMLDNCC